jgi:hypothetical protein
LLAATASQRIRKRVEETSGELKSSAASVRGEGDQRNLRSPLYNYSPTDSGFCQCPQVSPLFGSVEPFAARARALP